MSTEHAARQNSTDKLSDSDVFHVLSNSRRRHVLCILVEHGPCTKREIIDETATREFGVPDVPAQERKRVHISLHQAHLPKLVDMGVIRETSDGYELTSRAERVTPYLDADPDGGSGWWPW